MLAFLQYHISLFGFVSGVQFCWGGALRTVPVGGDWKNKCRKTSSSSLHPVSGGQYPPTSSTSVPSDLSLALLNTAASLCLHLPKASQISSLGIVRWKTSDGGAAFGGGGDWVEVERPWPRFGRTEAASSAFLETSLPRFGRFWISSRTIFSAIAEKCNTAKTKRIWA
ncbi:hypothetical protein NE237_030605 [Protea cynaroides]|uniref:Secreted protein n=1 Tax=Protea cynaroides TaxID=273540 RepID=A0A9Q0GU28_9MAGN|nr:hypothetical protein NE237_030605 [Protea cynaroides]